MLGWHLPDPFRPRFDVQNSNVSETHYDAYRHKRGDENLPDVIIVKKSYGSNFKRHKKREWKVKRLKVEEDEENNNKKSSKQAAHAKDEELLEFYNEIEEDEDMRGKVQVFKDSEKIERNVMKERGDLAFETDTEGEDDVAEDVPEIPLADMLDDLNIGEMDDSEWFDFNLTIRQN